ncbi:methionine ABC transporter ATP-binding protein [Fretibacterium fastidiosum]|uniref:methionine ABC transporter ATP-binding protein n=1 Tax=Fretibacterium fastidiosum TaxID=651822 RepID=UPI0002F20280|nr:ATP-binding cassette domain-containing protein [Fretibacterium fastidiosum]
MIELEHIVKRFRADGGTAVDAVNDVSLRVEDGEIYGIIGFSGAGKSTLVRCINLLERPTSGSVRIDGVEMTELAPKDLYRARRKIGMIFQQFNLMPSRTVGQNVAYPLAGSGLSREQVREKVRELLSLVDILDKEGTYPSELSGGQKQRVAIARALANEPKILLCDEATSALDPQTTASILRLIRELNRRLGLTVVVITHEMEVVKSICSRTAVMERGRIVEEGSVFDIFATPQHRTTKNFVRSTSHLAKAEELVWNDSNVVNLRRGEILARLTYLQNSVSTPLISSTARKFDIDLNIILADVEIVADALVGGTVVIFQGERRRIEDAIEYLRQHSVRVEVIKDADVSD